MKVLNICSDDFANFMHDNAKALRSVGVDCVDLKTQKHVFNYSEESIVVDIETIRKAIDGVDVVQIFHSEDWLIPMCEGKKVVMYHTGTRYRQRPEYYDKATKTADQIIIALPEFYKGKGERYIVGAVDTDAIKPVDIWNERKVIGHFPSNPKVKGTEEINDVVLKLKAEFDFDYLFSDEIVSHDKQLDRISKCDIYIEMLAPEQMGKKYGSFGITGLEAASMGKVVLTQNIGEKVYANEYCSLTPFVKYADKDEFERMLRMILKRDEIGVLQKITRDWAVNNHSYKATGRKLKQIIYELF